MIFQLAKPFLLDPGAAIHMRGVFKKFRTSAGDVTVLNDINAMFHPGEFVGVIGKSGSGKTTLVNMLTGIDRPTAGEVQVGKTLVHRMNESDMSRWRGVNLGIVFQFYQLLPVLTLLENVMLPMDIAGRIPAAKREERARELLRMVGLENEAHKMPAAVSGGQQQTAAIARALANDPPFLIADEPTGNLDSRTAENVFHIFEDLVAKGKTIIMVTHDPQLARRTTRTVLLSDGEIVHPAIATAMPWLSHPQMMALTHQSRELEIPAGAHLISPGQPVDELYLVCSGELECRPEERSLIKSAIHLPRWLDRRGERFEPRPDCDLLTPGQIIGAQELLERIPTSRAVVALEPARVLAVDGAAVRALADSSPAVRGALLHPQAAPA
jgi:putative ABC transport system ATP-binding protein